MTTKAMVVIFFSLVAVVMLLALALIGPGDWNARDPGEQERRELMHRQIACSQVIGQYALLAPRQTEDTRPYPVKIKPALERFLASHLQDVEPLEKLRQEIPAWHNVYTGKTGFSEQYADFDVYNQATAKQPYAGFLIYQALGCAPIKSTSQVPTLSCAHFKLYRTGKQGQLLNVISE